MSTRRLAPLRLVAAAAVILALAVAPTVGQAQQASAVGTTYQPIEGAGSTWSANALQQWIRNVFDNYRWKISYSDQGSSAGRQLFAQGTTDFGVSEIPYALANSDSPDPRPARSFAYVPIVAGGTAFMYNLVIGGQRVTNLRLSGEVIAKIFTGVITKWNDPAIAADNPALSLPAIAIVPVVRSDGSGTTAQLTSWMRSQYPAIWNAYCAKAGRTNCGITSNYPVVPGSAFLAQQGSNQVASTVAKNSSVGAITYVEASYAINARFPVAKMLNAAGYYNEPTASNVAVSLLAAVINNDPNSQEYLTANLAGVYTNPDPRTYPLSSYSYMIIPTAIEGNFTEDKGLTLADFTAYFLCEGQQQADVLGYSPLPINLVQGGLDQVTKIPGGNPANKSIASCNNPTFSPDGTNKLAATAPQPQACDKKGSTQCLTGTGGASGTNTPAGGGTSPTSGTNGGTATDAPTEEGGDEPVSDGVETVGGGGERVVAGEGVALASRNVPLPNLLLMVLAVVIAFAAVILPPIVGRRRAAPRDLGTAVAGSARLAGTRAPPSVRRRLDLRSLAARLPRLPKPNVHLLSWWRKGARAERPGSDS